jgi:hypothetical protein
MAKGEYIFRNGGRGSFELDTISSEVCGGGMTGGGGGCEGGGGLDWENMRKHGDDVGGGGGEVGRTVMTGRSWGW